MGRRRFALTFGVLCVSLCGAAAPLAVGADGLRPGAAGAPQAPACGSERLEGMVMDVAGTPAGGVIVSLSGSNIRREAMTNNGGGFTIEPVTPGVYLLSATIGSVASEEVRVEVRAGEAPPHVTLTLRPPQPVDLFTSMPIAGRLEVFLAGENLLNDRFETGRTPVVTPGSPRTVTAGVRLSWSRIS